MVRILPIAFSLLLIAGCAGISPPTHFYTLDTATLPPDSRALAVPPGLSIGIEPIQLPDLLDRPQIVTRPDVDSVQLSEFNQWAGELKAAMARLMTRRLMQRLATHRVAIFPWPQFRRLDYRVSIEVLRFDGQLGGDVSLEGVWSLVDGAGERELATQAFSLTERAAGPDHADLVATLTRITLRLSDQVAEGIAGQTATAQQIPAPLAR